MDLVTFATRVCKVLGVEMMIGQCIQLRKTTGDSLMLLQLQTLPVA